MDNEGDNTNNNNAASLQVNAQPDLNFQTPPQSPRNFVYVTPENQTFRVFGPPRNPPVAPQARRLDLDNEDVIVINRDLLNDHLRRGRPITDLFNRIQQRPRRGEEEGRILARRAKLKNCKSFSNNIFKYYRDQDDDHNSLSTKAPKRARLV